MGENFPGADAVADRTGGRLLPCGSEIRACLVSRRGAAYDDDVGRDLDGEDDDVGDATKVVVVVGDGAGGEGT